MNFLSNDSGEGKTYIARILEAYWLQLGLKVRRLNWSEDFDINSSKYLLSNSITDIYNQTNEDIVIVEYPNLESNNVPTKLLQKPTLICLF